MKGKINVSVENIFPLIKKFLYSDHEIYAIALALTVEQIKNVAATISSSPG